MLHFSPLHILLAVAVVFLLFGPRRLPELARGLGDGMKEFKKAMHEMSSDASVHASDTAGATSPSEAA